MMHKPKITKVTCAKILTGVACVGVGLTTYLAIKRGGKVMDTIAEVKEETKDMSKLKASSMYIRRVAPVIAPIAVSVTITEGCVIGAQVLSLAEIAGLTTTIAGLMANQKKLEEIVEKIPGGKEALEKYRKEAAIEKAIEAKKKLPTVEETGHGKHLIYEAIGGRYFRADPDWVRRCQKKFNEEREELLPFSDGNSEWPCPLPWNRFYELLGIWLSEFGHEFGYPADDDYYESRSIEWINTIVKKEDAAKEGYPDFGEDIMVISVPGSYFPMQCWQEV